MKISINGKIVDPQDAFIPVLDRGYLFGEGLFETLRSYKGKVPFLDKHLNRMEWGATFINIPFPHPKEIEDQIKALLKVTNFQESRIKIVLTGLNDQTSKPQLPSDHMNINCVIFCEKHEPLSEEEYQEGVALALIRSAVNDPPPSSNIKSTSWLPKMVARRELAEKDCYDGVLLNALGYVTETTAANIFWFKGRVLHTPPITAGLLPGITRSIVIDLAKELGLVVKESLSTLEEVLTADEAFISNSIVGIMPVCIINEENIGKNMPGTLTQNLREAYAERFQEELAALD